MRDLRQLVDTENPGIDKLREWIRSAVHGCELLPPSADRDQVLLETQVTTRSTLGALVYETGGALIDGAWLRVLGSGHPRLRRTLPAWNLARARGFCLVADDAAGGFFALNGGALGDDPQNMYYWAPDSLEWEPLKIGFTDFFVWALSDRLRQFYESVRWTSWREDIAGLPGDQCYSFYPFLWNAEGSITTSHRTKVTVQEHYGLKTELVRQLGSGRAPGLSVQ